MAEYRAIWSGKKGDFPKLRQVDTVESLVRQQDRNIMVLKDEAPILDMPSMFPDKSEVTSDTVVNGVPVLTGPTMNFGDKAPAQPRSNSDVPVLDLPEMKF